MIIRKADANDYKKIKKLYREAFPADERAPFVMLKDRAVSGRAVMLAAEDRGAFIGFAYIVEYGSLAYLFYLAVVKEKRDKGYGGELLRTVCRRYRGKCLFLARERLDKRADNYEQRVRRRRFYADNGFKDVPLCIKEGPVLYDVMTYGGCPVSPEDYQQLVCRWTGKLISCFVHMKMFRRHSR